MSKINITQSVLGGENGGGGYVNLSGLQPGDTFVFNTQQIADGDVFWIKTANPGEVVDIHGNVGSISGETVLLVKVTAQVDA